MLEGDVFILNKLHIYLNTPKSTLCAMAKSGRIPALKLGKHRRFRKSEIARWLDTQKWMPPLQPLLRTAQYVNVSD